MCWTKFCFFVLNNFAIVWLILANARGLHWSILKKTSSPWFFQIYILWEASFVVQLVKNLPAMQETWVWSLGWEDPLEKGKATHSSILAWRIPWQKVGYDWATFTFTYYEIVVIGGFKWIFRGYWWGITAQHTIGNNFHCFSLWLGPAP